MDKRTVFDMLVKQNYIPNDYKYDESLTWIEIEDLMTYRPSVSYENWQKYRQMTDEELDREFPMLKLLVHDCQADDIRFYATRFWLHKCGDIDELVQRWKSYEDIGINARNILAKLYPMINNSLQLSFTLALTNPSPFEQLILSLDLAENSSDLVRSLSSRYGFGQLAVPDPTVELYYRLHIYISSLPVSNIAYHPSYRYVPLLTLLNFNKSEYDDYLKKYLTSKTQLIYEERIYYQLFLEFYS